MPATRGARFCGCNSQKQQNNQIAPSLDDIRSVALPPPSPPRSVLPACPLGACCPCWLCWSLLPCRVWLSVFPPPLKRELDLFDDLSRRPSRGFCNSLCTAGEPIKCNSSKSNCQCCSPLVLDSRERSVPKRLPGGSWIQDAPPWQAPDWSQRDPVT